MSSTLKDRLQKRRKDLRESMTDSGLQDETSAFEMSSRTPLRSGANLKVSDKEDGNYSGSDVDRIEELQDAENLVENLASMREEKKRELSTALESADDVSGVQSFKTKPKKKGKAKAQAFQEEDEIPMIPDEEKGGSGGSEKENIPISTKPKARRSREPMSMDEAVLAAKTGVSPGDKAQPSFNTAIKERIRRKMQQTKEKAEQKMKEEVENDKEKDRPARRLRLRPRTTATTRFDDPSLMTKEERAKEEEKKKKEEEAEAAALEKVKQWKDAVTTKRKDLPSNEMCYDFFTKNFEEPPKSPVASQEELAGPSTSAREEDPEAKEGETDEAQPLTSDAFVHNEDWRDQPIEYLGPDYLTMHERDEKLEGYFFVPSVKTIPPEDKISEDVEPRYLEDEGFYVGVRPQVTRRNQNVMEARLLMSSNKGKNWFGDDGRIKALPNPIKAIPSRPRILNSEDIEIGLQTVYRGPVSSEFDNRFIDGHGDDYGQYQLDLDVNMLIFTHHSLFSKEHVLATRLQQLFDQYLTSSKKGLGDYYSDKLKVLKSALLNLREQVVNMKERDADLPIIPDLEHRVLDYQKEVRQIRKMRDSEMLNDRTLLKNMLHTWREIKVLREKQGCTNTPLKLTIRKEESDKAADEQVWKLDMAEELEELREEHQQQYSKQMEVYKAEMEQWKKFMKEKKKKGKKTKRGSREGLTESQGESDAEPQDSVLEVPKPDKPQKDFNEENEKIILKQKYKQMRRKPGEPYLFPELSNTAVITPSSDCAKEEQSRRNDMQKSRCFIKVLINNKEVSRTGVRTLSSDFTIRFGEIFNVQIVQWPESIKLQVFESGMINNMLAEVFLAIPATRITTDVVDLEEFDFSSDQKIAYTHSAVGSGYTFELGEGDNPKQVTPLTSGVIMSSVAWGMGEDDRPLIPPQSQDPNAVRAQQQYDAMSALGAGGVIDIEKLSMWINEARLDPNDPVNSNLIHTVKMLRGGDGSQAQIPDYFRLEQLQEEFNFVSDEDLNNSKRFQMIEYRQKEIPEFRNIKFIPCQEKEIQDEIFKDYESRKYKEEQGIVSADMEPHRAAVAKFLGKVRAQVMARFLAAQHQFCLEDVVNEEAVPNIGLLGGNLLKLAQPRRPLRPQRKERKTVTAQNLAGLDVHILINIERAFDIPVRSSSPSPGFGSSSDQTTQNIVRPFVEVLFQQNKKKTTTTEGPNPNWNEEIAMPFKAPNNDYSPTNLQSINDLVYLNLFDEVVIDMLEDNRQTASTVHRRVERRWLGSIQIPFSTIYFQGKLNQSAMVEGAFRVQAPSSLLGYERGPESSGRTYLSMFITIEPPLAPVEPTREKFDSKEDEKLLAYADNFVIEIKKKFPKREVITTVMDINGKSVFVTRYFRPLTPPPKVLEGDNKFTTMERVARFVSLISFVSDSVVYPGICDIWSTCDQFLQMLQGDEEEHAVLLCNYFLQMGKKTWVLKGSAIPEGSTVYVLTADDGEYKIWNPSTGEWYYKNDTFCPLKSVMALMNNENIWANIQPSDAPNMMDFDTSKSTCWKPFFHRGFSNPGLSSVQPNELVYQETSPQNVLRLQDRIEKELRDAIMNWRPRHITRWNRYCTQEFRKILETLEFNKSGSTENKAQAADILSSYNLCGFPLHMSYTDMRSVIEKVRSTGVHENESSNIEFALAVHIHPYPNNILSLWVYIASLSRKR
ncbi:coiled-coil and C2 domain-containing protein 2A-like isoform X1 [Anneissia japonica]|uniref:coiled-coil and C2 domain-containing protein 2A-like isoform X1 n=2 Tax=Anneissia japonica TaxID=1529436 RepID=UPI0014254BF7|nr:coiled-coil and C2 domain-containing protein 2A-like isoform X1 [Anneissia japonica]